MKTEEFINTVTPLAEYLETYRKNPNCNAEFLACNASKLQSTGRRLTDFAQNLKVLVQIENSKDTKTTNEWAAYISHNLTDILMLERCHELAGKNPTEVRYKETLKHDDPRHKQPFSEETLEKYAIETVLHEAIKREVTDTAQLKKALGHLNRLLPVITKTTGIYQHKNILKVASFYKSHPTDIRS